MLDKIKKLMQTGFFYIFCGSVFNKIITFSSSIVIVHILTKYEYGTFTYAWNIYSFVILANGLGLSQGALQFGSENWQSGKCEDIFSYSLRKGVIFDLIISLIMLLMAIVCPMKIRGVKPLLAMMCMLPIVQYIFDLFMVYLRVKRDNKLFARLSVVSTILIFLFSVVGSYIFREKGLIIGRYLAWIVIIIASILLIDSKFWKRQSEIDNLIKTSLIKVSTISMINNGISQLLYLLDILILGIVLPNEETLANYKVATTIPTALLFIPSAIVTYIYPYFAAHSNDTKWCLVHYRKLFFANCTVNLIITLGLFLFAPQIISVAFGSQYLDAVPVFRLLSLSYFFSSNFRIISSNLLVMIKKLKFNLIEAILSGIVNIIADYFFIKWYGSVGAAVATIIVVCFSGFLSTAYLLFTYKKGEKGLV